MADGLLLERPQVYSVPVSTIGKSGMKPQSTDTDIKTEAALIAMLRKAKTFQKFAQVRSLSQTTLSLSRRAILRKNRHLQEGELLGLFVHYQYGKELADRFRRYMESRDDEDS